MAPFHEMPQGKCNPVCAGKGRIAGIGFFQQGDGPVPIHPHGKAQAKFRQDLGIIRVQRTRRFQGLEAAADILRKPLRNRQCKEGSAHAG